MIPIITMILLTGWGLMLFWFACCFVYKNLSTPASDEGKINQTKTKQKVTKKYQDTRRAQARRKII